MIFKPTDLPGAFIIQNEAHRDNRGFFCELWNDAEFAKNGIDTKFTRAALSFNAKRGTLRGMHFQKPPHEEAKLVRAVRGAVYDVIVDLRPSSKAFKKWIGVELRAGDLKALYVPPGFGHGFLALEDDTEVLYQFGGYYAAGAASGVRWNDAAFGIKWPFAPTIVSAADSGYADFK